MQTRNTGVFRRSPWRSANMSTCLHKKLHGLTFCIFSAVVQSKRLTVLKKTTRVILGARNATLLWDALKVDPLRGLLKGRPPGGKWISLFSLPKIRPHSRHLQNVIGVDVRRSVAKIRDLTVGEKWSEKKSCFLSLKVVLPHSAS